MKEYALLLLETIGKNSLTFGSKPVPFVFKI